MKEDVPVPETIPRKRRQLEAALPLWLAVWLARDDLTPSERRRLEAEKARRKTERPRKVMGVIVGREGVTPAQLDGIAENMAGDDPTEIRHAGVAPKLMRCFPPDVPVATDADFRAVVTASSVVLAAPKEPREPVRKEAPVWAAIKYAKHRKVPIRIILPNGEETS